MNFYTPLRYPGGKGKLATYIKAIIAENDLLGCAYAEVYAGGAGVAMELLLENYVSSIYINDLNIQVYSFWHSVLNNTDELCKLINDTPVCMAEWYKQKEAYALPLSKASHLERGFATFFLNRTNRSGILNAGVIGGKEQSGIWKLDARYTKADLIDRIEAIAARKKDIKLTRMDALQFITGRLPLFGDDAFTYLDPPYYVKGAGLYDNSYGHEDHEAVAKAMKRLRRRHWVVSYDDTPAIRAMYSSFSFVSYNLSYSAAKRYKGSEVMYFSKNLILPNLEDYGYRAA